MSKRIIIIITSVIVVLAAAGYFAVLPQVQADNYISAAKTSHASLRTEADKLKDLFELDLFTEINQKAAEVQVDVKNAKEVLSAVKDKLAAESDSLTAFHEYPLLSWHPTYKDGIDLYNAEKIYVDKVNLAVKEFDAVIEYFEDSADIHTKIEAGSETLNSMATMSSIEEIVDAMEEALKTGREGLDDLAKLTPPAPLKEYHDQMLDYNEKGLVLVERFVVALEANDAEKVNSVAVQISKLSDEGDAKAKELQKELTEESVLRKYLNQAADANKQVTEILGKS